MGIVPIGGWNSKRVLGFEREVVEGRSVEDSSQGRQQKEEGGFAAVSLGLQKDASGFDRVGDGVYVIFGQAYVNGLSEGLGFYAMGLPELESFKVK